jgi:hypothetical protein
MANYRKEPLDHRMLEPLKNRPDLEPDAQFVIRMRAKLASDKKQPSRYTKKNPVFGYVLASTFAIALFSLIAAPYLLPSVSVPEHVENVPGMDFEETIAGNDTYREFYENISKTLGTPEPAKIVIYYFEFLRQKDADSLKKYLLEGDLQTAQELILRYEGMDHSSIAFENMVPSKAKHSYEIYFSYMDLAVEERKSGSFLIETMDEKIVYVSDPPEEEKRAKATNFELTKEESDAYGWFTLDHNRQYLKELSPISIAKLYVQAQLDKDYSTQYALYTSREDRRLWTLEEGLDQSEKEDLSREEILDSLGWITSGKFIKEDEISGHIEYTDENGNLKGFRMIMDEDGIWKVAFLPVQ